jgi:pimeloyl-ACP methyl ester carboxylesterase
VLFDWRGHGKSGKPQDTDNMSAAYLMNDLLAVMNELKIRKSVLVGHSMGTQLIYDFYAHHRNRVLSLISCFGTFGKPLDTFYNTSLTKHVFEVIYYFNTHFPKIAGQIGRMMGANPLWFQMGSALKMMNPGLVDKKIMKQYMDHITSLDPVLLAKLTKSLQSHDTEPVLKTITVPTLIIAGEEDTFTPVWVSKKKHHLIPNSELMIIKKASHVALVEQPELINLRIEKFLRERSVTA